MLEPKYDPAHSSPGGVYSAHLNLRCADYSGQNFGISTPVVRAIELQSDL